MKTTSIKEKLHQYIEQAEEKKLIAIYTMVEEDIAVYNKWNDKEFVAEMKRRTKDLETGKVKGYSLPESKRRVMKKLAAFKTGK